MKRFLFIIPFLVIFIATSAFSAGERHHPTGKRYGYVDLPLTSFTTVKQGVDGEQTASIVIPETDYEGTAAMNTATDQASKTEAMMGRESGLPAIWLGNTDDPIEVSFPIPDDYWRDGVIEMLVKSTSSIGDALEWGVAVSTESSLDTSLTEETDVATASPTSGVSLEKLTFTTSDMEGSNSYSEDSWVKFRLNKKFAGPDCRGAGKRTSTYDCSDGNLFIYDAYFKYEKKTDS